MLELSLKHLLDGPASEAAQQHERRVDSLQVSVIEASTTSTSGDVLRIHERHFNGDTGGGKSFLCAWHFTIVSCDITFAA